MARFHPTRGNSGLERRRVGLDRVDSVSMGGIVISSCCYGPRHHDLTPVHPGPFGWSA
jgi:hypothetical protein